MDKRIIGRFLSDLRITQRYSPDSIRYIGYTLADFVQYLEKKDLSGIDLVAITDYFKEKRERRLVAATLRDKMWHLRVFLNYLEKKALIKYNPLKLIRVASHQRKTFNYLSEEEVRHLLVAPRRETDKGYIHFILLLLLYATGMRVSELCRLKTGDLNLERNRVKIRAGKGGKARVIPFPKKINKFLREYLLRREDNNPLLFPNLDKGTGYHPGTIQSLVRRYTRKAGIKRAVTPHTLRHSYVSHLAARGARIRELYQLLGHRSLRETSIYIHVTTNRLKSSISPHPVLGIVKKKEEKLRWLEKITRKIS